MVYIRKLTRFDQRQLREHFLRLSPVDRRFRFFGLTSDAFITDYTRHVTDWGQRFFGAFADQRLRGVGEIRLDRAYPSRLRAEIAVSVEDAFRQQGVGARLVDSLITLARNRGVREVAVPCLPDNRQMRRLIAKFQGSGVIEEGVYDARIDPPWPDVFSGWKEVSQDLLGAYAHGVTILRAPDDDASPSLRARKTA